MTASLVVIEGLDGAGKATLASAVAGHLVDAGIRVGRLDFPRYGRSVHADLAAEALRGQAGDLVDSVYAMATLFALDRAGAVGELAELGAANDVVLLDRYVASNLAYGAARLAQPVDGEFGTWVGALEFDRLGLPRPDLQLYLDTPVTLAELRARSRELKVGQRLDAYEQDASLQARTGERYADLAGREWVSRWEVLDPDVDPADVARAIAAEHG